jgi:anti-sigma regulatory factor (Ser/Thr protein kinase)
LADDASGTIADGDRRREEGLMSGLDELRARGPRRLSLPFTAESVRVARHALDDWFDESLEQAEIVADCRLVMTELVGNAVRHARPLRGGTVDVHWQIDDQALAITVSDGGGPSEPAIRDVAPDAMGGRGLTIVQALAHRWWVEHHGTGTTVHAVLALV